MNIERLNRRSLKLLAVSAAGSSALWLSGCGESSDRLEFLAGVENANATSVSLIDGANIRSESSLGDSYNPDIPVHTVIDPITIELARPVYEARDANGLWVGIHEVDLKNAFPDKSEQFEDDEDGIFWVNHQKAEINE